MRWRLLEEVVTLTLLARVFALLVGGLTLAFLALDLTANRALFLPADVVLGVLLIGAALLPNRRVAALGMLVGFAYTAGVFSISATIAVVRGPFNISTALGLAVTVFFVVLLGWKLLGECNETT